MKKKNDPFKDMSNAAVGLGTVGLAVGVGSAVATKAGVPGLSGSFNTLTGFTGIAATAYGAKTVLKTIKKIK